MYLLYCVCIAVFTLDAALLASSQYSEGPATGHLDTGFSRFPCVYKQTLRWFPTFQVATTCFSCSLPDLNLLVTSFIFCIHVKQGRPPGDNPIAVNKYIIHKWGPCHHGVARSHVANGGTASSVEDSCECLNELSRKPDKGCSSSLGVGRGANNFSM